MQGAGPRRDPLEIAFAKSALEAEWPPFKRRRHRAWFELDLAERPCAELNCDGLTTVCSRDSYRARRIDARGRGAVDPDARPRRPGP